MAESAGFAQVQLAGSKLASIAELIHCSCGCCRFKHWLGARFVMANRDASTRETSSHSQRMVSPVLRIALLLGIAVHLAGFLIFRVVSNPLPDREPAAAFVQFLSTGLMAGDADLEEKAILFDSAPLFIPTRWNASSRIFTGIGVVDRQLPDFEPAIDLTADLQPSTGCWPIATRLPNRSTCWPCAIGIF